PLAQVDENAQPRRVWEEFFVRIAREIEAVMQREMFTPPGGPTYIPREYIVYLNAEDDHEWRGEKRRGLEQGLFHILSGRARELSGHTQLATKSFAVELRVDGTLSKGEFRVQPVWDSSEEGGHTMVTPRPMPPLSAPTQPQLNETELPGNENEPNEGEVTQVRARPIELYSMEVWHNGVRQTVVPVMKPEATIGRGSRSTAVDVPLKGDPEVSRLHAILTFDADGKHWLTAKGRNPTMLSGREAPREERVPVAPDDKIDICSYTLRIQPK
nr:FHA domain-containing protein [Pyrinomonadaceae bacterium]